MTQENKDMLLTIGLGTVIIAVIATLSVYYLFGASAGYFFMIVLAVPLGAISSLLLLIIYNANKSK